MKTKFRIKGSEVSAAITCTAQSTLALSSSTAYLQVYNQDTPEWETLDSDNTTAADTNFTLSGNIDDLTNYKDIVGMLSYRIYQEVI